MLLAILLAPILILFFAKNSFTPITYSWESFTTFYSASLRIYSKVLFLGLVACAARDPSTMLNWEGMDRVVVGSYLLVCALSLPVIKAFFISSSLFLEFVATKAVSGLEPLLFTTQGSTFSK
jgi:hypothetical protein